MEEVTAGVYLVSINRSRYSAVYGWGPCENGFPSRGHQRGSASAAAQAWLEKEICNFSPSKTNIVRLSINKSLSVYGEISKNQPGNALLTSAPQPSSYRAAPAALPSARML
jgi:hypothetical protein